MIFEWDERKNTANIRKHGIDFADVQAIFDKPILNALDRRKDYGEDRWIGMGTLKDDVIVVVFVERSADVIRIVSARKATKRESEKYYWQISH